MIPSRNICERNRSGSISTGRPARLRRINQEANDPNATAPTAMRASTDSPPSCHTRMPSTMPPMPMTDRIAPTRSMWRDPVYGTSRTRPIPESTIAMITASSRNPTRQDRNVVMNPPRSGPTAAAIAAEAPTSA